MEEKRPKVLALYQAVLALLDEGADINAMKVSDITERAGIGKGTAYDYFKSKEEIIAGALTWEMDRKMRKEIEQLHACRRFSEKIHYVFDWISGQYQEQKGFVRSLRLSTQRCEAGKGLIREIHKKQAELGGGPINLVEEICRTGKESGEIRSEVPAKAASVLVMAEMAAFAMFLEKREEATEVDSDWMKNFLCEGLLKSLA